MKEKKKSWFSRRKQKDEDYDFVIEEEITPIGGDKNEPDIENYVPKSNSFTGEIDLESGTYIELFDFDSDSNSEQEQTYKMLEEERRRRASQVTQSSWLDLGDVEEEFGIIAPMPVTVTGNEIVEDEETDDEFQKVLQDIAKNNTMELKLNVLNDTVEIKKNLNIPMIDDETANQILSKTSEIQHEEVPLDILEKIQEITNETVEDKITHEDIIANKDFEDISKDELIDAPKEEIQEGISLEQIAKEIANEAENEETQEGTEQEEVEEKTPAVQVTQKNSDYRPRILPIHVLNVNNLQEDVENYSKNITDKDLPNIKIPKIVQKAEKEEEYENEYKDQSEAKTYLEALAYSEKFNFRQTVMTCAIAVIMLLVTQISESSFLVNTETSSASIYICTGIILLIGSTAICYKDFSSGLKALFAYKANSDSFVAMASITVLLQSVLALFYQDMIISGSAHVYAVIIVVAWALNSLGKLNLIKRIQNNFKFVISKEQKYVINIVADQEIATNLTNDCVVGKPVLAYKTRTGFLKNFFKNSNEVNPSDAVSRNLAPITFLISLILCTIVILTEQDVFKAVTVFAAATCLSMPLANILSVQLPLSAMSKATRRSGSLVTNYRSISKMAKINSIMVNSDDLFNNGTVTVGNVKILFDENMEYNLSLAASLCKKVGGTVSFIGEQISEDSDKEVNNYVIEYGIGIAGAVDGKRVLFGTKKFMLNHGVFMKNEEVLDNFESNTEKIIYVSVDGRLISCFDVNYRTSARKKAELHKMEDNGISLILHSADPNLTVENITSIFGISPSTISIIPPDLSVSYDSICEKYVEQSDSLVATKGKLESLISLIVNCTKKRKVLSMIIATQTIGIIMGLILIVIMAFWGGISQMSGIAILAFIAFFAAISLILPKISK